MLIDGINLDEIKRIFDNRERKIEIWKDFQQNWTCGYRFRAH